MSTSTFFPQLLALDAKLVAKGFPALAPFWRRTLESFFRSSRRRLVLRVGRRGGKSLSMCKLAVCFAVAGSWAVPPGEVALIPFLSVDRTEASARLRTIAAMLDALGVPYTRRADEIELTSRPVLFRVVTASVTATVGFTSIMVVCDEVSRWRDAETGANPAREVLASLGPTIATQPNARIFLCSSPWSTTDYHAESFSRGDDEHQQAAAAPTWIANPTLSERQTHGLEPDPRIWSREYAAMPADSVSAICSADEYERCVSSGVDKRPAVETGRYATLIDAGFRNDWFVALTVHRELRERGDTALADVLVVDSITTLVPTFLRRVTLDQGVRAVARHVAEYPGKAFADIHYFDALSPELLKSGVKLVELPNTSNAISERIGALEVRLGSGTIDLLDHAEMRRQVLQAQLVLHQAGRKTLKAPERKGAHDDIVSALLFGCDAAVIGKLPAVAGDIVVRRDPIVWAPELGGIQGGAVHYYKRMPGGRLVMREPPYGGRDFEQWASHMISTGHVTPSIARWQREQQEKEAREGRAINVNTNVQGD